MRDVGGHLPADVADEPGDDDPGDRVGPAPAERHADQTQHRPGRRECVQPRMLGVGHHGCRPNSPVYHQFVAGHQLVADDPDDRGGDAPADVSGAAVPQQFGDALEAGDHGAAPDHQGHPDAGQVLGAFVAVGVALGRELARRAEADEHQGAGRDVGQVVQRIAEQRHRTRHHRDDQFDQPGQRQAGGADGDGPVGLPALTGVVGRGVEGKAGRRVADPVDHVHTASMPHSAAPLKCRGPGHVMAIGGHGRGYRTAPRGIASAPTCFGPGARPPPPPGAPTCPARSRTARRARGGRFSAPP